VLGARALAFLRGREYALPHDDRRPAGQRRHRRRRVPVGPGSVVFVPADEAHRFVDVTEELEVLVVFVPAESAG
jgi:oxalate decarboxylase/phosphoglucose isomerase-like protein (cupin superfamily)